MPYNIKLSELARLGREDQERELEALTRAASAPANGRRAFVSARIRDFEIRHEVSSAQMVEELKSGTRKETAEIAEWLFWLGTRDNRGGR